MSNFEELYDELGRNTVHFRAKPISATWSVLEDEGVVDERLEIVFSVVTELRDDELKVFTHRYREGWVTLVPLRGDRKRNEDGQTVFGHLAQNERALAIRMLVHPTYLAGLSALVAHQANCPITISVWPHKKLWEWDGDGQLQIRHCEITVGSASLDAAK